MKQSIFISYKSSDRPVVERLAHDLNRLNFSVWFDEQLTGGQSWWDQILQQIREADYVVVALSPSVVHSEACKYERDYARRLGKSILPILIAGGVEMSHFEPELGNVQAVDYINPTTDSAFSLANALHSLSPSAPLPALLPSQPPVPASYLHQLSNDVNFSGTMPYEKQNQILGEFRRRIMEEDDARRVIPLLERFARRGDISQSIAQDANTLIMNYQPAYVSVAANPVRSSPPAQPVYTGVPVTIASNEKGLESWIYYGLMLLGLLFPIAGWIGGALVMFVDKPSSSRKEQGRNIIIAGFAGFVCGFIILMSASAGY